MLVKRRSLVGSLPPGLAKLVALPTQPGIRLRLLRRIGLWAAGCIVLILVLAGIQNIGWIWTNRVLPGLRDFRNSVNTMSVEPRSLAIDINFKGYQWLAYKRQQALDFGYIVQHEDSFVPAKIRLPDRTVEVKMRLKGDLTDHIQGEKWSYRIKVDDDDTVFGMRFFSIQDPGRSSYVHEWVFTELMRHEGLIAPRYDFIHVTINGKPMGIYALEESFSKEMLEAHGRREAPVVRFNESRLFSRALSYGQHKLFYAAEVDAFQSAKTEGDPVLRKQFAIARDLLEGFRDQHLPVDQVFDLDKTATYFALVDLCSAGYAARWKNIRFYYDPISSLLEPIPYNGYSAVSASLAQARKRPTRVLSGQYVYGRGLIADWMDAFFRDPVFYKAYVRALARISERGFVSGFFAEIDDRLAEKIRIIHKDVPSLNYPKHYLLARARLIHNAVNPGLPIRVHFDIDKKSEGPATLDVANTVLLAIELTAVVDRETGARYPFQEGLVVGPNCTDVPRNVSLRIPDSARDAFAGFEDERLALTYHVVGMPEEYSAAIQGRRPMAERNLRQRLTQSVAEIRGKDSLGIDEANRTITLRPGTWRFDRSLIIPPGYTLLAGPGVTVELHQQASLISFSPLLLRGTADEPVVIRSPNATGGGVAVIDADGQSSFEHVSFENLASPTEGLWTVTGAVTVHESPVDIADCRFVAGRAEDQLNIVRTRFTLARSEFTASAADALDVDFSRGTITDCTFTGIGNDAVDASGSQVVVERCRIDGAGDKALSAGENSSVRLNDFEAVNCGFGLVSKDLSTVTAKDVTLRRAGVALAVYQKKPEYGPASITIEKLRTEETAELSLIEKGSWINLDGHKEPGTRLAVAREIYGE